MSTTTLTVSTVNSPFVRAKELIAQHQLIAFFVLTYAFAWMVWFVSPVVGLGGGFIGAFGPAFAAIVITGIIAPEKVDGSHAQRWVAFALGFVVSLSLDLVFAELTNIERSLGWLVNGAANSALVGFLVSGAFAPRRGVRELLAPMMKWRVGWSAYAAALLLFPAIFLLAVILDIALGGQPPAAPTGLSLEWVLVAFVSTLLIGGPLFEEPGWRGFALPRLQTLYSPLIASLILGLLWSFWHAPLHFNGFYAVASNGGGGGGVAGLLLRFAWNVPLAIVFTWLYNRSRRSLLIVILLHTAVNNSSILLQSPRAAILGFTVILYAFVILIVISARMWRKRQPDGTLARAPA